MNQWLSKISDNRFISQLSIPGTHNSAAFKVADPHYIDYITQGIWKCQNQNIEEQLNKGIRYFDLRIGVNESNKQEKVFCLYHMKQNLGKLQEALNIFILFLQQNINEFLILQIQQEYSSIDPQQFGKDVKEQFKKYKLPVFNYLLCDTDIPTVGQLRGKIWLIQAAKCKINEFQINTSIPELIFDKNYILQNKWTKVSSANKIQCIKSIMEYKNQVDILKINYLSCSYWSDFLIGKYGYNRQFMELLQKDRFKNIGITIMDYPSQKIVKEIIKINHKQ